MTTNEAVARWTLEFSPMIERMVEESGLSLVSHTDVAQAAFRLVSRSGKDLQGPQKMGKAVQKAAEKIINYWKNQEKML